jgi:hypothetical protein
MEKISVHEILLRHGKWIGSSEFATKIAKILGVTDRQAYNLITKAYKEKKIKKHIFPDRTVMYGLSEFSPPVLHALTPRDLQLAQKRLNSIVGNRAKLFKDILNSLFFSNDTEPGVSEYSANKERLKSDHPEIYGKLEKYEKALSELREMVQQNKEDWKKADFDPELKKPFEFVDAYLRWNPKTTHEDALKSGLEEYVKNFVDSYRELTEAFSTCDKLRMQEDQ